MFSIRNLTLNYEGEDSLFSSLSLDIERGKPTLIISEPGEGKTSFAKLLTGVADKFYAASYSGTFSYDGIDLFSLSVPIRKSYVARSIQNTDDAILFPTVSDEVAFPLEQRSLDPSELKSTLSSILEKYGLSQYGDADTSELSGGEKRRLNLAVLEAINPKLYIYDEAFDELSSQWRKRLLSYASEKEYLIVLGSHYLKEYDGFFSSSYELKGGRLLPYEKPSISFSFPKAKPDALSHSIELSNITFRQEHKAMERGGLFTLKASSMSIRSGEVSLLTGDNGSGKSTLSRLISGLRKEDEGTMRYDGRRIGAKERRRVVSYLFQNPFSMLYLPTVRDELMSVASSSDEAIRVASLFSLSLDSYTQELSYGKAKLLESAIYYILDRPFAIFDEVDSAISYADTMRILSLYLEKGAGVLMISHDERIISSFRGAHYQMKDGLLS